MTAAKLDCYDGSSEVSSACCAYLSAYDELCEVPLTGHECLGVLIPGIELDFPLDSHLRESELSLRLIGWDDLALASDKLERINGLSFGELSGVEATLGSYSIEFAKWEEVLASKVWLGEGWTEQEIYLFAAYVLRELCFLGGTREKHEEAYEKFYERIENVSEEPPSSCVSLEDLCREYRDYGIEQIKYTESPFLDKMYRELWKQGWIKTLEIAADLFARLNR